MIGQKIKDRRLALGWTQEILAERMGYKHCSSINKIELGINDIPQSKIAKFADVLGVSIPYLLGIENNQKERVSYYDRMLEKFKRLDDTDRARIEERIDTILESDKYKENL